MVTKKKATKEQAKLFREIPAGSTFYRKVGTSLWVMVKANSKQAVMLDDAPASMRGEPTLSWNIPKDELMVTKEAYESYARRCPDAVFSSGAQVRA